MADNFFGITDTGRQRENNEDTFIAQAIAPNVILASVIDGVGGYEGGEVAAEMARETIVEKLTAPFADEARVLKEALIRANEKIYGEKQKAGKNNNMACVLTVALAFPERNEFYYAHVGDTRMYLLRDGSLVKVTKDQSFVGFLEDSGRLTEREAMLHPKRNEIYKALGFDGQMQLDEDYIETGSSPFLPGDLLLLCSDGLTDLVANKEMTDLLLADGSLKQKAEALVQAANSAGGKDNITAVLVANLKKPLKQKATKPVALLKKNESRDEATEAVKEKEPEKETAEMKGRSRLPVWILTFLCLVLAGTTYWFWKQGQQLIKPPVPVVIKSRTEPEKRFADSLRKGTKTLTISAALFDKNLVISDTVFIRQDSLHLIGDGLVLQNDSAYAGPAFFITASCKYLLLENLSFRDFNTAIVSQSTGLHLKKVLFQNVTVPVQQNILLPLNDTLTGVFRDAFLLKKDSTHK